MDIRHAIIAAAALAAALLSPRAGAQTGDAPSGGSSAAYDFLGVSPSPKVYGLGGVNVSAVDGGLLSTEQNPALLGGEYSGTVALSYMRYIGDSNFASAAFSHRAGERGAWSASLRYFGYGSMDRTDATGIVTGTFNASDIAAAATYSHDITGALRGGATLKVLYSSYDSYTAAAIGVDLGVNYYDSERDLSLSGTVVNLGGQVKRFDERYTRLPVDVRLGWTQSFAGLPVRFSVTAWNLTKWHVPYYATGDGSADSAPELKDSFGSNLLRHLVFAADLVPSDRYYVCLGYNYKTRTDMATYSRSFLSGFSLGAGIDIGTWGVGIALSQPHTGATTFMLSLSAGLDRLLK